MHATIIFMLKSCIFSIYVLLGDIDSAEMWAADIHRLSTILTGPDSEDSQCWRVTVQDLRTYFNDKKQLAEVVGAWSLEI